MFAILLYRGQLSIAEELLILLYLAHRDNAVIIHVRIVYLDCVYQRVKRITKNGLNFSLTIVHGFRPEMTLINYSSHILIRQCYYGKLLILHFGVHTRMS